jgi:hypothetical protein
MKSYRVSLRRIRRTVFYSSLVFIAIFFLSVTVFQALPVEFADEDVKDTFYEVIMMGFPIAILLTLTGTMKKGKPDANIAIFFITGFGAFLGFCLIGGIMLSIGFAGWNDTGYALHRKKDRQIQIKEHVHDFGALGSGGKRIVQLKPFLRYWNIVTHVDTTAINKDEWYRDEPKPQQPVKN